MILRALIISLSFLSSISHAMPSEATVDCKAEKKSLAIKYKKLVESNRQEMQFQTDSKYYMAATKEKVRGLVNEAVEKMQKNLANTLIENAYFEKLNEWNKLYQDNVSESGERKLLSDSENAELDTKNAKFEEFRNEMQVKINRHFVQAVCETVKEKCYEYYFDLETRDRNNTFAITSPGLIEAINRHIAIKDITESQEPGKRVRISELSLFKHYYLGKDSSFDIVATYVAPQRQGDLLFDYQFSDIMEQRKATPSDVYNSIYTNRASPLAYKSEAEYFNSHASKQCLGFKENSNELSNGANPVQEYSPAQASAQ